jgi:hypothetical protein
LEDDRQMIELHAYNKQDKLTPRIEVVALQARYAFGMRVFISKYELRDVQERYPTFEDCPDYVAVSSLIPVPASMGVEERVRMKNAIETHISQAPLPIS